MPEPQAADAITPATVTPEVAAELHKHLAEQGRQQGNVHDLSMLLGRATQREWGTTKARRFKDDAGGGWLIELSAYLDGEELYAIVRSSVGGSRLMTAVVDADEVDAFGRDGKWQSNAARGNGVDPEVAAMAEAIESGGVPQGRVQSLQGHTHPTPAGPVAVPPVDPNDPMLVVVTIEFDADLSGKTREAQQQIIRATREEVPGIVKMLLSHGVKIPMSDGLQDYDVTEGNIEVWSSCSKPKVEVRF
jgi:hypothetical protein